MTGELTLEDVATGDELEPRVIDEVRTEDTKLIAALLEDPYPPHYDPRFAAELGYPDLLNQGPVNFSYLLQAILPHLRGPSDIRTFDMKFRDMVFVGNAVTATATVEDTWIEDESGDGVVEFAVALEGEDGTVAVDGTVTARLPRG